VGREVETEYGCFRCGAIRPEIRTDDNEHQYCKECGERGIVSQKQALDMLNEIYRRNRRQVMDVIDLDEYYIEEATESE
jgi:DNA-directed RNA polymerase subunit RPC12/RpoP